MDRYELSQDFQEKQLQLLARKYGGVEHAGEAALTIQRAFRRYSMAKKFAVLTAQVKSEKRISRRIEFRTPTPPLTSSSVASHQSTTTTTANSTSPITAPSTASPPVRGQAQSATRTSSSSSSSTVSASPSSLLVHGAQRNGHAVGLGQPQSYCVHHHHHHPHHHHHHRQRSRGSGEVGVVRAESTSSSSSSSAPGCAPASTPASATPSRELPEDVGQSEVIGVRIRPAEAGDSLNNNNSSCTDFQSFPLDETSVYAHSSMPSAASRTTVVNAHHHHHHYRHAGPQTAAPSQPRIKGGMQKRDSSSSRGTSSFHGSTHSSRSRDEPNSSAPALPKRSGSHATSPSSPNNNNIGSDILLKQQQQLQMLSRHLHLNMSSSSPPFIGPDLVDGMGGRGRHGRAMGDPMSAAAYSVNEVIRKRHYRTGLNIFNKKPEKGIAYLIRRGFLENQPQAVARFLITRKGLSKQMIGEYLGNLNYAFNMAVLDCFAQEMDFSGMHLDTALRKFQTYFRMPGEAQKIERLVEVFSGRFCQCNPDIVAKLQSPDTTFILSFAIILLNTDLHTPSIKADKRMKLEDFLRNLRGIDNGQDVDHELLAGIFERIRSQEFRPGSDHVTQVIKVQQSIVSKCPNLAVPHRRLVCYCRLYEVHDPYKKERPGLHQREVFLFNDLLVITKIHSRKKNTVTYAFRQSLLLAGMSVSLFETQFYPFGIQMAQKWDRKIVLMLNARNEHDRSKFVEDLRESIAEMDEMEALRLEAELEKQRLSIAGAGEDAASGSVDTAALRSPGGSSAVLRRSAINNSLLDLTEVNGPAEKMTRRGSVGSLDSGMSVSLQSGAPVPFGAAAAIQRNGKVCNCNNENHNSVLTHANHGHSE